MQLTSERHVMNYPAQGYGPPPQGYGPPPQQYAPAPPAPPQGYPAYPAQPGYPPQQGYGQQPAPQGPPPAEGSIDAFYSQPSGSFGNSVSWKDKPLGSFVQGIVAREITGSDVIHDSDPQTQQLKYYKDGRPKFVMKVPLLVQPSQEFPEGEATWFVRGQARDELNRAVQEAGAQGPPAKGAFLRVTLVERKAGRQGGFPANIVQVQYQAPQDANGQAQAPAQPQQAQVQHAPVEQAPAPQYAPQAPAPQPQAPQGQDPWAQQQPAQPWPPQGAAPQQPQPQQFQQTAATPAPQYAQQAPAQPQAPQGAPQPPAGLDQDQQALLARLTGQQG
jgi:hypothetical protein